MRREGQPANTRREEDVRAFELHCRTDPCPEAGGEEKQSCKICNERTIKVE